MVYPLCLKPVTQIYCCTELAADCKKNGAAGGQFCAFIKFYLREEHEILILFINTGRTVPVDYKHQICYSFC